MLICQLFLSDSFFNHSKLLTKIINLSKSCLVEQDWPPLHVSGAEGGGVPGGQVVGQVAGGSGSHGYLDTG
jgi:hypothetical protein